MKTSSKLALKIAKKDPKFRKVLIAELLDTSDDWEVKVKVNGQLRDILILPQAGKYKTPESKIRALAWKLVGGWKKPQPSKVEYTPGEEVNFIMKGVKDHD